LFKGYLELFFVMDNSLNVPAGWSVLEYKEGAPKIYGAEPGPQTGEDEYHSQYVDPDGKFGAAKTERGSSTHCSYGGEEANQEEPEGSQPYDVGQLHLEDKEVVVEDGRQRGYHYYLVTHPDEEYFYSVIPKLRGNKETYKSPHRNTRKQALEDTYRVLNVTLPASISDQMHYVYPESEI
jgi:hypothetical protein